MNRIGHVVYLHGFASSPHSSKATRFAAALSAEGIGFTCPDFNQPSFETLTVTRMLEQASAAIAAAPEGPVALVGSSLGGFVAVHAAAADTTGRVDRLVLMAPALDFGGNRLKRLGEQGIEDWRRSGRLRVFHYGEDDWRDIGFGLYDDAAKYDAYAVSVDHPALVIQGRRDALVDPDMVANWCAARPVTDLHLVDDDHQLAASWDVIWCESAKLLGI
jgi:pimeloyl-ACP methyl ester carboxylesterase